MPAVQRPAWGASGTTLPASAWTLGVWLGTHLPARHPAARHLLPQEQQATAALAAASGARVEQWAALQQVLQEPQQAGQGWGRLVVGEQQTIAGLEHPDRAQGWGQAQQAVRGQQAAGLPRLERVVGPQAVLQWAPRRQQQHLVAVSLHGVGCSAIAAAAASRPQAAVPLDRWAPA
jgi:hypothetical protein